MTQLARPDDPIPLVDLAAAHGPVADEIATGFAKVLATTSFVGGAQVDAFEREFAAFSGRRHCVGVANGTDAIELALRALGVGTRADDEVILPANSFVATAEAVARAGARPVLVDADEAYHLLDPEAVAAAITSRTRAVVPVHLYGQLAPVEAISEAVAGRDIVIVEDAAQAQGATRHGAGIGSAGPAATSFYPGKNLGAYGDAGAVLTDDETIATTVRALGSHGSLTKYTHTHLGFNSRMDTLQAVVLSAKLARLAGANEARRAAADRYDAYLGEAADALGVEVVRPRVAPGNVHVWHLYVIRVAGRDRLLERLRAEGIGAGIHYPYPIHHCPPFADRAPSPCPVTEKLATEILSLPLYPEISDAQQQRVVETLMKALIENGG
ncbi:DegT/DnrJ/EryC1/StrS family aminotransferase [Pseudofrankia asymbiotica]|uniref:Erythromycin biosynthesis sensory transduction protein eryC1 n=1 Tax=Pseudofrankia asymbiotica TaxID=1834516 RepID=A0A1V2I914_9ACTN|nr:DegT/DnrJ/EryC1/StrS family aminotransferase [Pseudofrankia asymbiotica]ONH28981.1 erythromycin biosynthesis sensory transduction protein eryC1 [Pseudofrankia asymbiotica]